jgi:hypothetical protein
MVVESLMRATTVNMDESHRGLAARQRVSASKSSI